MAMRLLERTDRWCFRASDGQWEPKQSLHSMGSAPSWPTKAERVRREATEEVVSRCEIRFAPLVSPSPP